MIDPFKGRRCDEAWGDSLFSQCCKSTLLETCQQRLLQLAQDDDEKGIHQVAFVFLYARTRFSSIAVIYFEMLQLPAIEKEPRHLLRFVQTVADVDHDLALDVTQRMIEVFKKVTDRHFYIEYDDTDSLPLTVYNRNFEPEIKEKAMRLFEELLEMGMLRSDCPR